MGQDAVRLMPDLRVLGETPNAVRLIAWPELLRKTVIVANISVVTRHGVHEVWASVSLAPLVAPPDYDGISWAVTPSRVLGPLGGPFEIPRHGGTRHVQSMVVTALAHRARDVKERYGSIRRFAEAIHPDPNDDPSWVTEAETRAYCLLEIGHRTEAIDVLRGITTASPIAILDDDDKQVWRTVTTRSRESLIEIATPGLLERRLRGHLRARLEVLGLDVDEVLLRT